MPDLDPLQVRALRSEGACEIVSECFALEAVMSERVTSFSALRETWSRILTTLRHIRSIARGLQTIEADAYEAGKARAAIEMKMARAA